MGLSKIINEIEILEADNNKMAEFLEREGYRKCDIAACNCGSWHKCALLGTEDAE